MQARPRAEEAAAPAAQRGASGDGRDDAAPRPLPVARLAIVDGGQQVVVGRPAVRIGDFEHDERCRRR